jgi:hypothetical protein
VLLNEKYPQVNSQLLKSNSHINKMTTAESRGVTKLLAKIKDSMEEKKYYEGKEHWETSRHFRDQNK